MAKRFFIEVVAYLAELAPGMNLSASALGCAALPISCSFSCDDLCMQCVL